LTADGPVGRREKLQYGIMQGRLTEPKGRGIQFFPFENWKNEFIDAVEIGLNEIEWIFDYEDYINNPLYFKKGQKEISKKIDETSVLVRSVCFDYFMRRPFYKYGKENSDNIFLENKMILCKVFDGMSNIGATLLEVPLVDNSSIKNSEEEKAVIDFLFDASDIAKKYNIVMGLESDYPPGTFRTLLEKIPNIRANYDTGNSSGLGYDAEEEIISIDGYICNLHIKDRVLHGTTVKLGTGNADFDKVFAALKKIGYKNSIIFQAARDEESREREIIVEQIDFIKEYIQKYQLGV
jgi:hexulose-6-phosphate isomerase